MRRSIKTMLSLLEKTEEGKLKSFILAPVPTNPNKRLKEYVDRKRQNLIEHLMLLKEAGYITQVSFSTTDDGFVFHGEYARLTMKGHDLLAVVRSDPLRKRMEEILKETGLPLTADSLNIITHEAIDELIRERAYVHKEKYQR